MESELRHLPSVDRLLDEERIGQLKEEYSYERLLQLIRRHLEHLRLSIAAGNPCPSVAEIVEAICSQVHAQESPRLRAVVNATGVMLHTNLGRAPLSREAIAAMNAIASDYCNLEFDLAGGRRASRDTHLEPILCELTGAEAALVVNNNAAGVLLALSALAKRKEVIVSRGQAVEIGGGFRIPDVMRQSGAKLVEVGTTNCTYITDYQEAIGPRTAALMRVHSSNFKLLGFTCFVTLEELVRLGNEDDLPVFDDLGSGCLLDTAEYGLDPEPMVQESVGTGAGLVLFSGDKLLGGPQAGVIVGKKHLVDSLKKHPLARALRIDKIRLAGLAATLTHYLKGEALGKIPVWRMISAPLQEIDERARAWAQSLGGLARVVEGETMVGGGSLPGGALPTRLVAIGGDKGKHRNIAEVLSQRLRCRETPVVGRISHDVLLLDPRSVLPEEDKLVLKALQDAGAGLDHC